MPLSGRKLDAGRYLMVAEGVDHPVFARAKLAALSAVAPLTFCELEEHVNWSLVQRWQQGRKVWSVLHQGENSAFDLQTEGRLPAQFNALKAAALERQSGEDNEAAADLIYELPLRLARAHTGMHPDDDSFGSSGFESFDAGLAQRWRDLPLLVRLSAWIAVFLVAAWAAGKTVRALF